MGRYPHPVRSQPLKRLSNPASDTNGSGPLEAEGREHRAQRRRPLGVSDPVRVEQDGEFLRLRVAVLVGEQPPGLQVEHLRDFFAAFR